MSIRFSQWPALVTSRNGHSFLRSSRKPSSSYPFQAPGAVCSSRLSSSTPAAVLELPAPGEAQEWPSGVTVPRFWTHLALWVAVQPPQPRPGPSLPALPTILPLSGPCPTLPPRPPGRTQPGSRARAVSVRPLPAVLGMQLDRGGGRRHPAPARPNAALRQAGGPSLPGPG